MCCCLQKPTNRVLSWCYRGRLSSPLQSGAFALKHLYAFNLHCSLIMYADLSWYLVAVDQALILQCNSMLQARRVWASKHMGKDWLCTAVMFPEALYESKMLLSYTSQTHIFILVSFKRKKLLPICLKAPSSCRTWKRWTFLPPGHPVVHVWQRQKKKIEDIVKILWGQFHDVPLDGSVISQKSLTTPCEVFQ